MEDEHGLNAYVYVWRRYYPDIGKWWSVDPADEFYSPYAFGPNNPINGIDPDGKEYIKVDDEYIWVNIPGVTSYSDGSSQLDTRSDYTIMHNIWMGSYSIDWFDAYFPLASLDDSWLYKRLRGTGDLMYDLESFTVGVPVLSLAAAGLALGGVYAAPARKLDKL